MRVGLIGFGKTGKAVANAILQNQDIALKWIYRQSHAMELRSASEFLGVNSSELATIYSKASIPIEELLEKKPVDFIFDFSSSEAITEYGPIASKKNVKIISAISHYNSATISMLEELAKNTVVFWSPNITLGINFIMFAANYLKKIAPWADIEIIEEHFKQKNGISGTAIKIANFLNLNEHNIQSIRAGGIVGKHEILFGLPNQTIRLIHESISREAFGNGAIFAALNLADKSKGFYKFEDILLPYFSNNSEKTI